MLDANILIYADDVLSRFHEVAVELRAKAVRKEINVCISPQILREFYAIRTSPTRSQNPLSPTQAAGIVRAYLQAETILKIYPKPGTIERAIELCRQHDIRSQSVHDAFLVATMLDNGARRLYTANTEDFRWYRELEVINPF